MRCAPTLVLSQDASMALPSEMTTGMERCAPSSHETESDRRIDRKTPVLETLTSHVDALTSTVDASVCEAWL